MNKGLKVKMAGFISKVKIGAKRNAPEILLAGSLITGTAAIITGVIAGHKTKSILDKYRVELDDLEQDYHSVIIDEVELNDKVKALYLELGLDLAKTYAIPFTLYASTVAMTIAGYKIQKNRQAALSTALVACTQAYDTLVKRLKDGAEANLTAQQVLDGAEVIEEVDAETGEVTKNIVYNGPIPNAYNFEFNRECGAWEKTKFQNECTLKGEEDWANNKLRLQGYLFLSDVLDRLGITPTKSSRVVGWQRIDDSSYVDFGITDLSELRDDNTFSLNFNVQGDIMTMLLDE